MANVKSFHAFTDDSGVHCGTVMNFVVKGKKVAFDYEYLYTGVKVTGSFEGEHEGDRSLIGEWSDQASVPINGVQYWKGTASLAATDEARMFLHGTWSTTGSTEGGRWLIDAAKK